MARAPSCSGTIAMHSAEGERQGGAEHEADALGVEQLGERVVERDVAAVDALDADEHVDDDGGQQAEQATDEEQLPDDLVVGRREPLRRLHRRRVPRWVGASVPGTERDQSGSGGAGSAVSIVVIRSGNSLVVSAWPTTARGRP